MCGVTDRSVPVWVHVYLGGRGEGNILYVVVSLSLSVGLYSSSRPTCTPSAVAVCCFCAVVVWCIRRRLHRGKYTGPQRLEDIWGEVEMVGSSMQSPLEEVRENISRLLDLGDSGKSGQTDWQDLESGSLDGEEGLIFSNPTFTEMDGNSDTWSFGRWVREHSFNEEKDECGPEEQKIECKGSSSEEEESDESGTEEDRSESGSGEGNREEGGEENGEESGEENGEESGEENGEESGEESQEESGEGSEEGSDKESKLSREESDEDTSSADDATLSTALLPPEATSEREDTTSTAALIPAMATEEATPSGSKPMTQEEMESALAELQKTEEELGGSLIGWDEVDNLLFNQWQDVQEMDGKGEGSIV